MLAAFSLAFEIMRKDKYIILFSLFPILIGIALYFFLGRWLYVDVYQWGREIISGNIESGWINILSGLLIGILTIVFYFIINWTFVIVVSLFACPFNDLISSRVELAIKGESETVGASVSKMFSNLLRTIFNEFKKIILILMLSLIGIILSFVLPPVSLLISALLVAISFIDYSWGRDDRNIKSCLTDMRRGIFSYSLGGGFFLFLVGIPLVNLLAIPYGVVFFTILYLNNQRARVESA